MKQLIYCIIIALSISLAFPKGKPCCNKKTKNTVSCKFNHTAIAKEKNISDKIISNNEKKLPKSTNNTEDDIVCAKKCEKKSWWKFWVKKAACPCQKAETIEEIEG